MFFSIIICLYLFFCIIGKRNDPRNVKYIAGKIAEAKQIETEEVARATYENAKRLFNL